MICGKTAVIFLIARFFGINRRYALATGLTLSQIGEFSFVLATTARDGGLIELVRSRFQRACRELKDVGATTVVDEENTVGRLLAHEALTSLELGQDATLACALAGHSSTVTATPKPDTP